MDGLEAVRQRFEENVVPHLKETPLLAAIVTVLVLVVTTRLFTGGGGSSSQNGSRSPPLAPYWIPFFGHAPRLFLSPDFTLTRFRNRYTQGIFSIRLFRSIHSFVFRPFLAAKLLELPESVADKEHVARRLMVTNFRLSKNDLEAYDKAASEVHQVTKQYLSGSHLDGLVKANVRDLDDVAAELVSFNSYQTDQMEWEKMAEADVVETETKERVMEADFHELMRNFVARSATASVFGTDFVENFDDIWQHLWVFNDGFLSLAMGVPLWAPLPTSQRARIALGRLHSFMREFHEDLDKFLNNEEPGVRWQDFHTISPLVRKRTEVFRKHNLSIDVRASLDVALFWSVTVHSASMVSWSLFELYQDPVLLEQIRDQVAPFVHVVQPKNEFGGVVWVPPKIEKLDMEGLMTKCPLLKAAYLETLRLHGSGWSARLLKEDVVLKDDGEAGCVLKKGTFAHVVPDLHRTDPKAFSDQRIWHVGRYLEDAVDSKGVKIQKVNQKTVQASDGTLTMCDDADFTMRKVYMYTSVLISLYNVEPKKGGDWVTPTLVKGVASTRPSRSIRLWIKPRALPKAK